MKTKRKKAPPKKASKTKRVLVRVAKEPLRENASAGLVDPNFAFNAQDWLAFFGALLLTGLLLLAIYLFEVEVLPQPIDIITGWLAPEPKERQMYLVALVSFPLLFIGLRAFLDQVAKARPLLAGEGLARRLSQAGTVALVGLLWLVFTRTSRFDFSVGSKPVYGDVYLQGTLIRTSFWIYLAVVVAACVAYFSPRFENFREAVRRAGDHWLNFLFDLAVFVLVLKFALFGINNFSNWVHLEAVFFSMTQVYYGHKTLLVDLINQYGMYPHFLEPIFRLWGGLTEWRFRIVMAVLMLISWLALWAFQRMVVKNRVIAFVGFIAVAYFTFLARICFWDADPYYQYFPIRFVTPCVTLFLAARYFLKQSRWAYFLAHLVVSLGVLWNSESGFITFAAWALTLAYWELAMIPSKAGILEKIRLAWPEIKKHAVWFGGSLVLCIGLFSLFILLRSGKFPNFYDLVEYQKIFYIQGFGMIRMVLVHPWMVVALLCAAGLAGPVGALFRDSKENPDTSTYALMVMLSIVGCGFFSYYQGRSHDTNMLLGLYAPVILATIFFDRAIAKDSCDRFFKSLQAGSADWGRPLLAGILAFFLFAPLLFVYGYQAKMDLGEAFRNKVLKEAPERFAFLAPYFKPGELTYAMIDDQSIAYSATKTGSLYKGPGLEEMILKKDLDSLRSYLMEEEVGRKLIAPGNLAYDGYIQHYNIKINPKYQVDAVGIDQHPVVYTQLPPVTNTATLFDNHDYLFHCREHRQFVYTYISPKGDFFPNFEHPTGYVVKTGRNFTFEIALVPPDHSRGQVFLSNLDKGAGFSMLSDGVEDGSYDWRWGDKPDQAVSFALIPTKWNYVAIVCQDGSIKAYVNGALSKRASGSVRSSGAVLQMHTKWSPWLGEIKELKISARAKSAEEIKISARKVMSAARDMAAVPVSGKP